jgi:hypothetical protein
VGFRSQLEAMLQRQIQRCEEKSGDLVWNLTLV